MKAPATRAVMGALAARGGVARFVGGCVRDAVIGREVADVDIATAEAPDAVIGLLEDAGLRAVPTGLAHGTVTAIAQGRPFEITTLRHDVETDGRHATVAFTDDWLSDAARRDFTFNAMFCDADGTLYDPFDGAADLAAGRVRFVGDARARIEEDVLRLLRFFRFYAHYGAPPPDPDALQACAALAQRLPGLSGERVRNETLKLLAAPDPMPAVRLLAEAGVLPHFMPEARGPDFFALERLVAIEARLKAVDPIRRLAALVVGAEHPETIAERLRLSNAQARRLQDLLRPPVTIGDAMDDRDARRALYRAGAQTFRDLVLLAWARDMAAAMDGASYERPYALADAWPAPCFPLGGKDVLSRGVARGPRVGELLATLEAWWIDGDFDADKPALLARLDALIEQDAR
jgi:poly(A) polymerase